MQAPPLSRRETLLFPPRKIVKTLQQERRNLKTRQRMLQESIHTERARLRSRSSMALTCATPPSPERRNPQNTTSRHTTTQCHMTTQHYTHFVGITLRSRPRGHEAQWQTIAHTSAAESAGLGRWPGGEAPVSRAHANPGGNIDYRSYRELRNDKWQGQDAKNELDYAILYGSVRLQLGLRKTLGLGWE